MVSWFVVLSIYMYFLFQFLAAVNKMIKEMIPNIRISNDARELVLNCCTGTLLI